MKRITLLGLFACTTLLSSCSIIQTYRGNIQQGTILAQKQLSHITLGMTKHEVIEQLGNPVLSQPFTPNRLVYINRQQPGYGKATQTAWVFDFQKGKLTRFYKK